MKTEEYKILKNRITLIGLLLVGAILLATNPAEDHFEKYLEKTTKIPTSSYMSKNLHFFRLYIKVNNNKKVYIGILNNIFNISPLFENIKSQVTLYDTINRIQEFNHLWQLTSEEVKDEYARDPNGYGRDFFDKAGELLTNLINVSDSDHEYLTINKQYISSIIYEFKDILLEYPEIYDMFYKNMVDSIEAKLSLSPVQSKSTTTTNTMP